MEFGIMSNGFRPHTSAGQTYDEDIAEIVLADQLGFRDAYISEHHAEPPHLDRVDTIPVPELMMCKAAALTSRIRMGAAVKLAHLQHPVDVAVSAAVTDHMLGGRFIFGFGTGFGNPSFCEERGLSFDDRHERLRESIAFIEKCWSSRTPFDWEGKHWQGRGVLTLPKPVNDQMPMAVATDTDAMIEHAARNGWTLLIAFVENAERIRHKVELYVAAGRAAGQPDPMRRIAVARAVYIADSKQQAMDDMREAVAIEVGVQAQRGFLNMMRQRYGIEIRADHTAIEQLVEAGLYIVGTPDEVAARLIDFHAVSGGWGTFMIVCGNAWADRARRARSMRLFMEQVAPRLRALEQPAVAAQ